MSEPYPVNLMREMLAAKFAGLELHRVLEIVEVAYEGQFVDWKWAGPTVPAFRSAAKDSSRFYPYPDPSRP